MFSGEFLYAYLAYVVAFTGAVLMLFLSVILMLPISSKRTLRAAKSIFFITLFVFRRPTWSKTEMRQFIQNALWLIAAPIIIVASLLHGLLLSIKIILLPDKTIAEFYFNGVHITIFQYWKQFVYGIWRYTKECSDKTIVRGRLGSFWAKNPGEYIWEFHLPGGRDYEVIWPGLSGWTVTAVRTFINFGRWFILVWAEEWYKSKRLLVLKLVSISRLYGKKASLFRISLAGFVAIFPGILLLVNAFAGVLPATPNGLAFLSVGVEGDAGGLAAVRDVLYDQDPLLLIITALVLLVALVGAAVFLKHKRK
jgi:NADH:ubiquinone oxidoreductase subunit 6 (subunit J)